MRGQPSPCRLFKGQTVDTGPFQVHARADLLALQLGQPGSSEFHRDTDIIPFPDNHRALSTIALYGDTCFVADLNHNTPAFFDLGIDEDRIALQVAIKGISSRDRYTTLGAEASWARADPAKASNAIRIPFAKLP